MAIDFDKLDEEQRSYAALVGDEAVAAGIPPDLAIAQAFQESELKHFEQNKDNQWHVKKSDQDAYGLMQITPDTAKLYGISEDELMNPIGNIRGGMKIMKSHFDKYGAPDLAVMAYHQGTGPVDKYVASGGKDISMFGLHGLDYVASIGKNYDFSKDDKYQEEKPLLQGELLAQEREQAPPTPSTLSNTEEIDRTKAFISGAIVGTGVGALERATGYPEKVDASIYENAAIKANKANERLQIARERLATHSATSGKSIDALREELISAQEDLFKAESNLNDIRSKYTKEFPESQFAKLKTSKEVPTELQHDRIIQGSEEAGTTGRARQQGYNERTAWQAANKAEQDKIAQDLAKKGLIEGRSPLTRINAPTSTPGGIIIPSNIVYEQELQQKIASAISSPQREALEKELQALRAQHNEAKLATIAATKRLLKEESSAGSRSKSLMHNIERAEDAAKLEQGILGQIPKTGLLSKIGYGISRIPGNTILSGGLTGMSIADAINRYKAGDYSKAVLSTIEATLGAMSMAPHPGIRGVGITGGLSVAGGQMLGDFAYNKMHPTETVKEEKPLDFSKYVKENNPLN